ncbi:hypothetical protein N9Q05_01415 [bacterium]|nr:hypothetical protein [bacterium]
MTYFSLHCEVDEIHKNMGLDYLMSLPKDKYKRLHQVQAEAWSMLEAAMHRIAELITITP